MASSVLVTRRTRPLADDKAARNYCIRLLAKREYSRHRLIKKLMEREMERSRAEGVVDALGQEGLQSDRRCTEAIQRTGASKGWSRRRLIKKLRDQGIDPDTMSGSELLSADEEQQRARALFDRWMKHQEETPEAKRRVLMRLARRGFPVGHLFEHQR